MHTGARLGRYPLLAAETRNGGEKVISEKRGSISMVNFTPLDETTLAEDIDDGTKIGGLTEADVQAIERLGFPRYEICSKKGLKERWGHNEPHVFLRFPITEYYSYMVSKDRRYLKHKRYSFRELACMGFTFEFYERMVIDVVNWFRELTEENKDKGLSWQRQIGLIKYDLRATKDERLVELARRL